MSQHPISQLREVAKRLVALDLNDPELAAKVQWLKGRASVALKTPPVVNKDLAGARKLSIKARQEKAAAFRRAVLPHIERAKRNGHTTYTDIAQHLNDNNVVSSTGTRWLPNTVRRILTN